MNSKGGTIKICIDCKHHFFNNNGALLCNHPLSNGHKAGMMRAIFESIFQEEQYRKREQGLCERDGNWYSPKV